MCQLLNLYFKNFGPVKEAEIDLRPLTIFVGPNNTGKTYTAYYIWALGALEYRYDPLFFTKEPPLDRQCIEYLRTHFLKPLKKSNEIKFSLIDYANSECLNSFIAESCQYMTKTFFSSIMAVGTRLKNLQKNFQAKLELNSKRLNQKIGETKFNFKVRIGPLQNVNIQKETNKTYIIVKLGEAIDGKRFRKGSKKETEVLTHAYFLLSNILFLYFFRKSTVIPAERTALTVAFKDIYQLRAEETFRNRFQPEKFSKYPIPVRSFLNFMYRLLETGKTQSFSEVVSYLEKKVIGGKIELERVKGIPFPSIYYTFPQGKMEIHSASSGIKAITPLLLFFERARPEELLIIDEPEINLHPKAQLKLMEALTMAVNKGLYIIISTHTPYLVDHLNNLMKAYTVYKKIGNKVKKLLDEFDIPLDSLISPKNVSVYLFKTDGKVENILDREAAFIDWKTFGEVTMDLETISARLEEFEKSEFEEVE